MRLPGSESSTQRGTTKQSEETYTQGNDGEFEARNTVVALSPLNTLFVVSLVAYAFAHVVFQEVKREVKCSGVKNNFCLLHTRNLTPEESGCPAYETELRARSKFLEDAQSRYEDINFSEIPASSFRQNAKLVLVFALKTSEKDYGQLMLFFNITPQAVQGWTMARAIYSDSFDDVPLGRELWAALFKEETQANRRYNYFNLTGLELKPKDFVGRTQFNIKFRRIRGGIWYSVCCHRRCKLQQKIFTFDRHKDTLLFRWSHFLLIDDACHESHKMQMSISANCEVIDSRSWQLSTEQSLIHNE